MKTTKTMHTLKWIDPRTMLPWSEVGETARAVPVPITRTTTTPKGDREQRGWEGATYIGEAPPWVAQQRCGHLHRTPDAALGCAEKLARKLVKEQENNYVPEG